MAPLICAWEWFPKKKGLITGIMVSSYGFSSFIFSLTSTELVNPDDLRPTIYDKENDVSYFDKTVANRVPTMLRILSLIWIVLVITGIVLISRKKRRT